MFVYCGYNYSTESSLNIVCDKNYEETSLGIFNLVNSRSTLMVKSFFGLAVQKISEEERV